MEHHQNELNQYTNNYVENLLKQFKFTKADLDANRSKNYKKKQKQINRRKSRMKSYEENKIN